jgi:hypothetical protein
MTFDHGTRWFAEFEKYSLTGGELNSCSGDGGGVTSCNHCDIRWRACLEAGGKVIDGLEMFAGGLVAEELLGEGVAQTTCITLAKGAQCMSGEVPGTDSDNAVQYEVVGGVCKCYTGFADIPDGATDFYTYDETAALIRGVNDLTAKGVAVCYLPADPTPGPTPGIDRNPSPTNLLSYEIYSAQTCSASSSVFAFSVEVVTSKSALYADEYFNSPCKSTIVDFTNGQKKTFWFKGYCNADHSEETGSTQGEVVLWADQEGCEAFDQQAVEFFDWSFDAATNQGGCMRANPNTHPTYGARLTCTAGAAASSCADAAITTMTKLAKCGLRSDVALARMEGLLKAQFPSLSMPISTVAEQLETTKCVECLEDFADALFEIPYSTCPAVLGGSTYNAPEAIAVALVGPKQNKMAAAAYGFLSDITGFSVTEEICKCLEGGVCFSLKPQLKIGGFDSLAAFTSSHRKAAKKVFADKISVTEAMVRSTFSWRIPKFSWRNRRLTTGNIEATFEISGLTESAMAYANTQIEEVASDPQSFVTQLASQFEVEGADVPPNMAVVVEITLAPTQAPSDVVVEGFSGSAESTDDDEGNNQNPLIFSVTAAVVFLIASACGYRFHRSTVHRYCCAKTNQVDSAPAAIQVVPVQAVPKQAVPAQAVPAQAVPMQAVPVQGVPAPVSEPVQK